MLERFADLFDGILRAVQILEVTADQARRKALREFPAQILLTHKARLGARSITDILGLGSKGRQQAIRLLTALKQHTPPVDAVRVEEMKDRFAYSFEATDGWAVPDEVIGKVFVIEIPEPPHLPRQSRFGAEIRSWSGLTASEIQNDPVLSAIHNGVEAVVTGLEIVAVIAAVTVATPVPIVIGALVSALNLFGSFEEIDPNDSIFGILEAIARFLAQRFTGKVLGDFLIRHFKTAGPLLAEITQEIVALIIEKLEEGIREITNMLTNLRD